MNNAVKAGLGLAAVLVAGFEGLRQYAYRDPVGIPTICFGHTEGVQMGDWKSKEECKALLKIELETYADGIAKCVKVSMPETRSAALTSFAYNVGTKAACNSSVVRLINAGRTREGCNRLLQWNKAGGIPLPGLTKRRKIERDYCVMGLDDPPKPRGIQ